MRNMIFGGWLMFVYINKVFFHICWSILDCIPIFMVHDVMPDLEHLNISFWTNRNLSWRYENGCTTLLQNNWSIIFKSLLALLLKVISAIQWVGTGGNSGFPTICMALERASVPLILFWTVNHTFKVCFTHMFLIATFFWDCLLRKARTDRGISGSEFCSILTHPVSVSMLIQATTAVNCAAQR